MQENYLLNKNYVRAGNGTYIKVDKKTGMKVELIFNKNNNNKEIEKDIINILTEL